MKVNLYVQNDALEANRLPIQQLRTQSFHRLVVVWRCRSRISWPLKYERQKRLHSFVHIPPQVEPSLRQRFWILQTLRKNLTAALKER